jgi:glycosyltransferase involved in cell wall biosynthesis
MPRISVIVPAHDAESTLVATVESAQRAGADEIVVVDDGSRDGTRAIARQLTGVTLIERDRAGGPAVARNAGLAASTGDFVVFLDSDDRMAPTSLVALLGGMSTGVVATLGRFLAVDENDQPIDIGTWASEQLRPVVRRRGHYVPSPRGFSSEALVTRLVTPPPSGIMVRRDAAIRIGGYDTALRRSEDIDFLVRLSREGTLVAVNDVVVRYRRTPSQRSQATGARQRGRLRTLGRMIWTAPTRRERWAMARGAGAHYFDRAEVRWHGAKTPHDRLIAVRSYLLGSGFRCLGVVAAFRSHT